VQRSLQENKNIKKALELYARRCGGYLIALFIFPFISYARIY